MGPQTSLPHGGTDDGMGMRAWPLLGTLIYESARPSFGQHRGSQMPRARDSLGQPQPEVSTVHTFGLGGLKIEGTRQDRTKPQHELQLRGLSWRSAVPMWVDARASSSPLAHVACRASGEGLESLKAPTGQFTGTENWRWQLEFSVISCWVPPCCRASP